MRRTGKRASLRSNRQGGDGQGGDGERCHGPDLLRSSVVIKAAGAGSLAPDRRMNRLSLDVEAAAVQLAAALRGMRHAADRRADPRLRQWRQGPGQCDPGHPQGHVRPARPQRRRQVQPDALHRHPAGAERRPDPFRRHRRGEDAREAAPHPRLPAPGLRRLSAHLRLRHAGPHGDPEGPVRAQGSQGRGGASAGADQSLRRAQEGAGGLLGRHAPEVRHRPGPSSATPASSSSTSLPRVSTPRSAIAS